MSNDQDLSNWWNRRLDERMKEAHKALYADPQTEELLRKAGDAPTDEMRDKYLDKLRVKWHELVKKYTP